MIDTNKCFMNSMYKCDLIDVCSFPGHIRINSEINDNIDKIVASISLHGKRNNYINLNLTYPYEKM